MENILSFTQWKKATKVEGYTPELIADLEKYHDINGADEINQILIQEYVKYVESFR